MMALVTRTARQSIGTAVGKMRGKSTTPVADRPAGLRGETTRRIIRHEKLIARD